MKRLSILLAIPLCLIVFRASAQSFEGEIVYKNSYVSKIPGVSAERLGAYLGTKQEYYVKGGYYKSLTNGTAVYMQLYDNPSNRMYFQRPGSDTLGYKDASADADSVISYEVHKAAATILGNVCDALVIVSKSATTTYYYCQKYRLDAAAYKRHLAGNWALLSAKAGALPLKAEVETTQVTMVMEAVEVKAMPLEDSFFKVGNGPAVKM
jgi:hypothetical protein